MQRLDLIDGWFINLEGREVLRLLIRYDCKKGANMKKEFNVYFNDGNHKILEATDVMAVMVYLVQLRVMNDVEKIERRR